jgi:DnaJ-class molecular chaperone
MHEGPDHDDFPEEYMEEKETNPFFLNCAFCKGTAVHPATMKSLSHERCPVCSGRGMVEYKGYRSEYTSCQRCRGTGREPGSIPIDVCYSCNGKGIIPNKNETK